MGKINNFQLYCMMVVLTGPIAFLESPKRLILYVENNAWLPAIASVIPGILIILLYTDLIKKSRQPFPLMLEEHLGKTAGKILGFLYIGFFILFSSYAIRLFVDFIETYVMPATPISVLISFMLAASFISLTAGLTAMARICEISVFIGLSFSAVILVTAIANFPVWENLLPLGYMSIKDFTFASLSPGSVWGRMFPVLTIAFFLPGKTNFHRPLFWALLTSVLLITFTSIATVLTFGAPTAALLTYPTFSVVRLIQIGEFVQHLDILFVGIWVLGMYATLFLTWFMACYTSQHVFDLKEYRFLAAPTSLIIGLLSLFISKNIIELRVVSLVIIPMLYFMAFMLIPLIVWLFTLFKPAVKADPSEELPG